jgi:hypothetical protein
MNPALFASGGGLYGRSPGVSNAFLEKKRLTPIFFGALSKNRRNPPQGLLGGREKQNKSSFNSISIQIPPQFE